MQNNTVPTMPEIAQTLLITNQRGLHARAAAKFVKVSGQFQATILVYKGELEAQGTSIMGLMMLAASKGCSIEVRANGVDAADAVAALADLVTGNFGEE